MRRRARAVTAGAFATAIAACNALTGAGDLAIEEAAADAGRDVPAVDGGGPADRAAPPDAELRGSPDAASDGGCTAPATSPVGAAKLIASGMFELAPATSNVAGAVVSPAMTALDAFDVTFDYSLTYSSTTPGAGVTFFAIAAPQSSFTCAAGPRLCTLGASAPGFAVVLRTSKVMNGDPEVPYLAVVDAQAYPSKVPDQPLLVDPSSVWTQVNAMTPIPPSASFHRMTVHGAAGKVTVAIDGRDLLVDVLIPGYVPGRLLTWGIGGATGQGNAFAHRTVVSAIALTCR